MHHVLEGFRLDQTKVTVHWVDQQTPELGSPAMDGPIKRRRRHPALQSAVGQFGKYVIVV